jgi:cyclopropane-fatty-acyl-phospholipid synthase
MHNPSGLQSIPSCQQPPSYAVECGNSLRVFGSGHPRFTIVVERWSDAEKINRMDAWSAALAFIKGQFDVCGDLISAMRWYGQRDATGWRDSLYSAAVKLQRLRPFVLGRRDKEQIAFHYDLSNDFYRLFLDPRMVYSCAYFKNPEWSLGRAQEAKLDHVCRKLDLRHGQSFLDIGCGWGGLVRHASSKFGTQSTGCTLSHEQARYARGLMRDSGLANFVQVHEEDYSHLFGRYNKISSVGMFEHVGRKRLGEYFKKVATLLEDDGLFLNHGIVRPNGSKDGPETLFVERHVFPGGQLVTLCDVLQEAAVAGFEPLDVENLRLHYALTCRAWVENLQRNSDLCSNLVGNVQYRTWLLYLSASASNFELGKLDLYQVLFAKRSVSRKAPMSRDYMYRFQEAS